MPLRTRRRGPRIPTTCAKIGYKHGVVGDGCGGTLTCGYCPGAEYCGGGGPGHCGLGDGGTVCKTTDWCYSSVPGVTSFPDGGVVDPEPPDGAAIAAWHCPQGQFIWGCQGGSNQPPPRCTDPNVPCDCFYCEQGAGTDCRWVPGFSHDGGPGWSCVGAGFACGSAPSPCFWATY